MFVQRTSVAAAVVASIAALALGAARPSSGARGEERHVVAPGDTLWRLAEKRYTDDPRAGVWRIQQRNGLVGAALEPGDVLYLPP